MFNYLPSRLLSRTGRPWRVWPRATLITAVVGTLSVSWLPVLPSVLWCLLPLLLLFPVFLLRHAFACLCWVFLMGAAWGVLYGHLLLSQQLPLELEGRDLRVQGRVVDLPREDSRRQSYVLAVDEARLPDGEILSSFPRRIQLGWYGVPHPVVSGETWQLTVRLKRPRGFANPAGFDYQVWLMRRGIGAQGYVRTSLANQRVDVSRHSVDSLRYHLRENILSLSDSPYRGILLALLLGDRSQIADADYQLLQRTGTSHLIAISGMHVGFVGFLGWLLGAGLGRLLQLVWPSWPLAGSAAVLAATSALVYSTLAGFSLPTQRAFIMLLTVQLALMLKRSFRPADVYCLSLFAVVMGDPLAAYDMGFWLSFGAVGILLLTFTGRRPSGSNPGWGRQSLRAQWVIFIGLLLPMSILIQSSSLVAPLTNLFAIPMVTLLIVPALLASAASLSWSPGLGQGILYLAELALAAMMAALDVVAGWAGDLASPALVFNARALLLAGLASLLLLLPAGLPGRWLAWPLLVLALALPVKQRPALQLTLLDVGQGLAAVVQTRRHTLVYDLGPAYSERFTAATGIVLPYLRSQGVSRPDILVISHNDADHLGGFADFLAVMPLDLVLWGEAGRRPTVATAVPQADCHHREPWEWDGVNFRFLSAGDIASYKPNDQSCVLLVEYGAVRLLLPGDITRSQEWRLMGSGQLPGAVTLVVAPHHGSRSSSARDVVGYLSPRWVLYSAAYRSPHGHPHPDVVERYQQVGSQALNTADSGAVEFIWMSGTEPEVREYRQLRRRYWY